MNDCAAWSFDVGNRTRKVDAYEEIEVQYHYDIEDPALNGPANNRLMYYDVFDTSGQASTLLSTMYYYYSNFGNVTRVVTEQAEPEPGEAQYSSTWLTYSGNGQGVNSIVGERWDWDSSAPCPTNYVIDYAREFWYYEARQRFLNREVDPVRLMNDDIVEALSETWSEYASSPGGGGDGNDIYEDFIITDNPTTVVVTTSYELGIAKTTDPLGSPATSYYHTDRLGTTRLLSDGSGAGVDPTVYSGFGELESGTNHRYGYVGTSAYQAHDEFLYLHVGARYYDPTTGRFLQRDPIGTKGGLNVYLF